MFQVSSRHRYPFVGEVMTDVLNNIRNNQTCDPWNSQRNEKMQFLFVLLLVLTF